MAQYNSKNQSSITSRRWYTDIDINMTTHPQSKDLSLKYDINAIKRSMKNLLSTNYFERPFKPGLGIDLRGMLFELSTTPTAVLEDEIIDLINTFEPRVQLLGVTPFKEANELRVQVEFRIISDPRPQELTVSLERIR
tara:strand:- start:4001 stop:4414 length:414 start_codon:yes stop_codon:yes gene_type:complete